MSRTGLEAIAARLAAASVIFSPRNLSIGEGLRAAAACASMVAAAGALHAPNLAWAAIGALWTCLADPGGLGRARLRAMGGFTILSTVFSVLAAGAALQGWGWASALVLLCAFLGTMARVYGREAAQVGTLSVVACAVAVDWPARSLVDVGSIALTYAGGCILALVLGLSVWRIHPFMPARLALETTFRALAAMAQGLAEIDVHAGPAAWAQHATIHRAAVRASIEQSRSAVRSVTSERGMTATGKLLIVAVEVAERIFAELIALSDRLERTNWGDAAESQLERRGLRELAAFADRYAHALRRDRVAPEALEGLAADLLHTALVLKARGTDGLTAIAEQIPILADPGFVVSEASRGTKAARRATFAPVRANLTWQSADLRHAVRCAVTVCAVVLVTHALRVPFAYWMAMAAVLVQQPSIATTWLRAVERVVGSTLGGALAAALGLVLHSTLALIAAVFPLAALTMAVRSINYSLFVLFLTPLFVLVVDITQPGVNELTLAGVRALNNLAGGVIALVACLVLWPSWEPARLRVLISDAIEANARYASLAFSPIRDERALDEARRAAGLASSNAEAARERSALEAWWRRDSLQGAAALLVLVRGLAGIATTAWLDARSNDASPKLAEWLRAQAAAMSARLRHGDGSLPSPPPHQDGEAARSVQQMALLKAAVERFISAESG
ncbi:MAG TPA: FUSC family protein [Candidatus Limnocylindria bacterium]|nr:FUSC family protein [Candidatus Limnocylindria bacterium]